MTKESSAPKLMTYCAFASVWLGACGAQKESSTAGASIPSSGAKEDKAKRTFREQVRSAEVGKGKPPTVDAGGATKPTSSGSVPDLTPTPAANSATGSAAPEVLAGVVPVSKAVSRFRITLPETLVETAVELHVRQSDGAFLAIGASGLVQISKDDGVAWSVTCTLPGTRGLKVLPVLSSAEAGVVLALTDRVYVIDQEIPNAGPCRPIPLPPQVTTIHEAALSKARLLVRNKGSYFLSENLGEGWSPLAVDWKPDVNAIVAHASSAAMDPGDPKRIVLSSCEREDPSNANSGRLSLRSRSSDLEQFTFLATKIPCPITPGVGSIALERDKRETIYHTSGTGTRHASFDGGKVWNEMSPSVGPFTALIEGGFARIDMKPLTEPLGQAKAILKTSPGGKGSIFSDRGSFELAHVTGSRPVLRGGKGRFLFSQDAALFASLDGGVTFKAISPLASRFFFPAEIASRDGKTLWALDGRWRVAASVDGGTTWTRRYSGPAGTTFPPVQPRIYIHPYNDSSLVLHEERFSGTYKKFRIATANGFQSADARDVPAFDTWAKALGFLSSDAESHYLMTSDAAYKGKSSPGEPVGLPSPAMEPGAWSPFPDLLSIPGAANTVFVGMGQFQVARYYAYDVVSGAKRNLLPALGMSPAGHAIARTAAGPVLRVISTTGQLRDSGDGLSFADVSPSPFFENCDVRVLSVLGANPGRMATACMGGDNTVNVTSDSGKTWKALPAEELENCPVSQIVVSATKTFVSCSKADRVLEFTL